MAVPLNTPLCLKGQNGCNIQNEFCRRNALCRNTNTGPWEQLILLQTDDKKIIIQSRWNGRNLQVQPSGRCVLANHNQEHFEKFDVEVNGEGHIYFISCHTGNLMQCTGNGSVWCVNQNRQSWEAWSSVYPHDTNMMTSTHLKIVSFGAAGLVMGPLAGIVAGALVPAAMSSFGTVVAGVGIFHAAKEALLQSSKLLRPPS